MRLHAAGLVILLTICCLRSPRAGELPRYQLGVHVMLGGRYDDLRRCVASPGGVPGGPIADVMLDARMRVGDNALVGFQLPVMRPILFGLAFDMLQFEPTFILEYRKELADNRSLVFGPGLGASFHYGADYHAGTDEERPERFFAIGPFISVFGGLNWPRSGGLDRLVGIRAFYAPLFAETGEKGTVLGAAVEGAFGFAAK